MKNIFNESEHNSKNESIHLNNTISCYHRPHVNYYINKKSKNQNKIKSKNINNNINESKEEKEIQLNQKKKLSNNSFNYSLENIISNTINKEQSLFNLFNINNKNICITNLKYRNNNQILINNSSRILNKSLFKINKKPSISKDIAVLCKIINSINYNNNNKLSRNKINKNNNKIFHTSPNEKITFKYFEEKIIKIQRWWRQLLYHLYIEKYILVIQRQIRKYLKRKNYLLEDKNKLDILKIILIQKTWKKYMTKKCLHNYYFFSFKKYIKPKKDDNELINISKSNLIHNINIINKVINYKNKKNNYYISKVYYRGRQIDNINLRIIKLQKTIKQFLNNKKNSYKNKNNNLINSNLGKCYIKKENNFDLINIINRKKEILKKIFTSFISYKLSLFFILLLNRIKLFNFIKIVIQRIQKNINYFVFIQLFFVPNNRYNSYSYFFQTIWRHIKINLNTNNEISSLLKNNIPKFFKKEFHKKYIPYINPSQEDNLLNIQLFINNNNDDLINYIFYFFEKEKNININITRKYIKNHLDKYNLKNKNIFYITRYIDSLYNNIIKKNFKINDMKENININNENHYIQTEEINCNINNNDIYEQNYIINRKNTYEIKHLNCKFMSYLDKKNEIKK